MFDSNTQKAVIERVAGEGIHPGSVKDEAVGPGTDALWRQFIGLSYELQELGVEPAALCAASGEVEAAREEFATANGGARA